MTEWQPLYSAVGDIRNAPKDRPFLVRISEEETEAQWDKERKAFILKSPFSGKVSGGIPMWKELPEPPK
jgi:hypothetical protein